MKRDGQLSPHEEAEIHTAHQRELRRAFYRRNPELPRPIDVKAVLDHTVLHHTNLRASSSDGRALAVGEQSGPDVTPIARLHYEPEVGSSSLFLAHRFNNSRAGSSEEPEYSGGQSTEKHKSEDAES